LIEQRKLPGEVASLLRDRVAQPWQPGLILTDDYAPFDLLMGRDEPAGSVSRPLPYEITN
jgi:hypothetical protein